MAARSNGSGSEVMVANKYSDLSTVADVHLHELRACQLDEDGLGVVGACSSQKSFPCSRRAMQQDTWRNRRGSIHSANERGKEMGCTHASVLMVINKHGMRNVSEFRRTPKLCS